MKQRKNENKNHWSMEKAEKETKKGSERLEIG